jgi:FdhD protein
MARGNGAGPKGVATRDVVRLGGEAARGERDAVAVEEPLEIRVDGEPLCVTMRTPGHDADLALGFLFAEGIIAGAAAVGSVAHCGRPDQEGYGNVLEVRSAGGAPIDAERVLEGRRWVTTTAACGVCGRRSIEQLLARCGRVGGTARLSRHAVTASVERLAAAQPIFARTGGLHAAALFAQDGTLLASAEDVGRHNAVDKAVGALLRRGLVGTGPSGAGAVRPGLLAVSGRASFEIVQKAAAASVPVVASVSAPSSLAVDLARQAGIALLGFVRGGTCNVYANAWRIEGVEAEGGAPAPEPGDAPPGSAT